MLREGGTSTEGRSGPQIRTLSEDEDREFFVSVESQMDGSQIPPGRRARAEGIGLGGRKTSAPFPDGSDEQVKNDFFTGFIRWLSRPGGLNKTAIGNVHIGVDFFPITERR